MSKKERKMTKDNGWRINEKLVLTKIQEHNDELKELRDHVYRSEKSICQRIDDLGKDLSDKLGKSSKELHDKIEGVDVRLTENVRIPFEGVKVKLASVIGGISLLVSLGVTTVYNSIKGQKQEVAKIESFNVSLSTATIKPIPYNR